jgi:hypothetical protein
MDDSVREKALHALEKREQDLIHHIRTSGLRADRETSLIGEIIEIRKARRQLVSVLFDTISVSSEEISVFKEQAVVAKREAIESAGTYKTQMELNLADLSSRLEEKVTLSREKIVRAASKEIHDVKIRYEAKLAALAEKISELDRFKNKSTAQHESDRNEIEIEIHAKYSSQLKKYQDGLKLIVARESEFKKDLLALKETNAKLSKELGRLFDESKESKKQTENALLGSKELNEKNAELIKSLKVTKDALLKANLAKQKCEEEHSTQLQDIDERVRALIESKENTISRQNSQLQSLLLYKQQTEKFILELNSGIQSARR